MSLLNYWPSADEVNSCIKNEAEGAHDAVLMAVHKPAPLSYRMVSSGERFEASEEELFNYLLTMDVPSGVHLVPITGASGVGKSHLVRIMTARLQAMNEDGRYVIIRIPKSASLRKVVELILDKLPGEEYDKVREEYGKALSEDLDVETAVVRFQNELEIALSELAKVLEPRVRANPGDSALKANFGHARNLSKFFGDPVLRDHFRKNVFPRFVTRAISGQAQPEDEVHVKDFIGDDFLLPDDLALSTAAAPTHQYYVQNLSARSGEGCRVVAKLLNESKVVDQAIRQLFSLNQSLGGMTLQDVIQQIRRVLLKQNRELVIFVEDFKALTGIQDTLLKVLIQEGVRDGVKQLATMRSVIAVTEGYLDSEDTITTRAKREWRVESELSDPEDVLHRTKALIASYLNAARWGYSELLRHYESRGRSYAGGEDWIGPFTPNEDSGDSLVLSAFGKEGEVPLFPFTERAIEQLAKMVLTRKNTLVFTPRFIIDDILRATLLPGRPAFEKGQFPSAEIRAPALKMEVSSWISSLPISEDLKGRYRRLVAIWGALPSSPSEVGYIPREVFAAFGLPEPDVEFRSIPKVVNPDVPTVATPAPEVRPDDAALRDALERWVQFNEPLPHARANEIRKAIATALNERIDWSAMRCIKAPIDVKDISIPHAKGEQNRNPGAFSIAEDNQDPSGQLRMDLAAITRFYELNGGKANYDAVDDDLIAISNFVARLMPNALALVKGRIRQNIGDSVQLLAMNSRILGLIERGKTPASLHAFLFSTPSVPSKVSDSSPVEFTDWQALQDAAMRIRPELTRRVVECCGSFQGAGKIAHAVDIVRALEGFSAVGEEDGSASRDGLPLELKREVAKMTEARVKPIVLRVLQKARLMRASIASEYGETFEKQKIVEELRGLADRLRGAGAWGASDIGRSHAEFRALCDEFRGSAIGEAVAVVDGLASSGEEKFDAHLLSRVARIDPSPLIVACRLADDARRVIAATEKRARTLEEQFRGVDPQAQVDEIASLFSRLLVGLEGLGSGQEASCS